MRRVLVLCLVVVVSLSLVGCKKKPRKDLAEVPPPTGSAADTGNSIYVGPPAPFSGSTTYAPPESGSSASGMTVTTAYPPAAPSSGTATMGGSTGAGGTYVVQRGDTLFSIAKRHYGDGRKMADIARANNIPDPNKIKVGQQLTLP